MTSPPPVPRVVPLLPEPEPAVDEFLEMVARRFGIAGEGKVTLELVFVDGRFRQAYLHSSLGRADLERGIGSAA